MSGGSCSLNAPSRAWASARCCQRALVLASSVSGMTPFLANDSPRAGAASGVLATPIGVLALRWHGTTLLAVELPPLAPPPGRPAAAVRAPVPDWLAKELLAYFANPQHDFALTLGLEGTAFQQRVWAALRRIPAGSVRTYGELAVALSTAPRAIGMACRANPCPIVVPCHRVVAKQGLGGFAGESAGARLAIKAWLLRHEGLVF